MATVTIRRSDLFPIGTVVDLYPAGSFRRGVDPPGPPTSAAISGAQGTVDGTGLLTITNANVLDYTPYVAAALVSGTWRYALCRSTGTPHGNTTRYKTGTTSWPATVTARRTADGTS